MANDSSEIDLISKKYDYSLLLNQLSDLRQDKERMRLLFELKGDFYRDYEMIKGLVEDKVITKNILNFGDFCQVQIDKIKELSALAKNSIQKDLMNLVYSDLRIKRMHTGLGELFEPQQPQNNTLPKIDKKKDRTIDRVTLFLNYLFTYTGVNCPNTQKAEIIEFLTAYSDKQTIKLFSEFEREKSKVLENEEISEKFFKDMKIIRKYFERLGLMEIVAKIDEDLGN
jgi:hypothetical protein